MNVLHQNMQRSTFFPVFFELDHLIYLLILLHDFPWWNLWNLPLLESWYYKVALIDHEVSLRTLRIARFRRKEFLRDQVELFVPFPEKFYQVVLIDRASWPQLSILEITKYGRNRILNNLFKESFKVILFLYEVALICHLQQRTSMNLVFRNISPMASSQQDIGFNFAVTPSSPESCWNRFTIAKEQTVRLKWLMLNKYNKSFHSSRVKFLLVKISASWVLLSMYLICILESGLIRSNNQSSATLWMLETCFVVGLLSWMIMLMTA